MNSYCVNSVGVSETPLTLADFLNQNLSTDIFTNDKLKFLKPVVYHSNANFTSLSKEEILLASEKYKTFLQQIPFHYHKFFTSLSFTSFLCFLSRLKSKSLNKCAAAQRKQAYKF